MTLYETLKGMALLPAILLIGLAIGLLLSPFRRRAGYAVLWISTILFYLASAPFTAERLAHMLESVPPLLNLDAAKDAQAIVVLSAGAGAYGPEYGGVFLDDYSLIRLRYTAHLYRLLKLPILVSGGPIRGTSTTFADAMKTALEEDFGVPVQWVENRSDTTGTNASDTAAVLNAANIHKIVLVTQALHMPRSLAVFRATGLEIVPAPTDFDTAADDFPADLMPRMSALRTSYLALYEAMGTIWYGVRLAPSAEVQPSRPAVHASAN